jgi:beta-xylosidase
VRALSTGCILFVALGAFAFAVAVTANQDETIAASAAHQALVVADLTRPVLNQDFPDPAILEVEGVFYAFATNSGGKNVQVARSTDMVAWEVVADAMPALGSWVQPMRGQVWAPETIRLGGLYLLYYTARDRASNRQCIGAAVSSAPEGPYRDDASQPLICPGGFQRAIDAHPYIDGRQLYLYYSGVCCEAPNGIFVQRLSSDGLAVTSEPQLLLSVDSEWEGLIAEAPTMVKREGKYFLFYSGNDYRGQGYAVGYAVCKSATGPCEKAPENPILSTAAYGVALGPGHQSIARVGNGHWMVFHGWTGITGYREGGKRAMWVQPLSWRLGKPAVGPNE